MSSEAEEGDHQNKHEWWMGWFVRSAEPLTSLATFTHATSVPSLGAAPSMDEHTLFSKCEGRTARRSHLANSDKVVARKESASDLVKLENDDEDLEQPLKKSKKKDKKKEKKSKKKKSDEEEPLKKSKKDKKKSKKKSSKKSKKKSSKTEDLHT